MLKGDRDMMNMKTSPAGLLWGWPHARWYHWLQRDWEDHTPLSGLSDQWLVTTELWGFRFGVFLRDSWHVLYIIPGFPKGWATTFLDLWSYISVPYPHPLQASFFLPLLFTRLMTIDFSSCPALSWCQVWYPEASLCYLTRSWLKTTQKFCCWDPMIARLEPSHLTS